MLSLKQEDPLSAKNVEPMLLLEKGMALASVWVATVHFRSQIAVADVCLDIVLPLEKSLFRQVTQIASLLWNGVANLANLGIY